MEKLSKAILSVMAIVVLFVAGAYRYVSAEMGQAPSESDLERYRKLPYFSNGRFQSPRELGHYPERVTGGKPGFLRFFLPSEYAPKAPLEKVALDASSFSAKPQDFAMYWLGHVSTILEIEGARILIDPVFGNAGPVAGVVRRYDDAPIRREDLPELDVVLITHDHYDHLEYSTMRHLKDRDVRFIVPLGVGAHLKAWGIAEDKIRELGWGESHTENGLSFTAEKAIHYLQRSGSDRGRTLWASYVIRGSKTKIFWSGDTGYGSHFAEIGKRYGPFDLAAIEIDGWNEGWPNTHLFPNEAVQAHKDLNAKYMLPVHWGVFDLALHPWNESIEKVVALAQIEKIEVLTPMMGERLVPGETKTTYWWRKGNELLARD